MLCKPSSQGSKRQFYCISILPRANLHNLNHKPILPFYCFTTTAFLLIALLPVYCISTVFLLFETWEWKFKVKYANFNSTIWRPN